MDRPRCSAPGAKTCREVAHEEGWPAEVEVRIARHAELGEHGYRNPTGGVEVRSEAIWRTRLAVADVASAPRERPEQIARLLSERMIGAVAGSIEPPDFPRRRFANQSVQHRNHGCSSHSGAQ